MTKELIEPYLNLKQQSKLTLNQCIILAYLCVRLDDMEYYDAIFEMIKDHITADDYWSMAAAGAKFSNERMSLVYEKLLKGAALNAQDVASRDALGLCALHYALIMRNKELIKKLLSIADWTSYKSPYSDDAQVACAYDFVFAACILFDDEEFISDRKSVV